MDLAFPMTAWGTHNGGGQNGRNQAGNGANRRQ